MTIYKYELLRIPLSTLRSFWYQCYKTSKAKKLALKIINQREEYLIMSQDILFNIIKNTSKNFKCYFQPTYVYDYDEPCESNNYEISKRIYDGRGYTIVFEDGSVYTGKCTDFEEKEINRLSKFKGYLEHPEYYDFDIPAGFPKWFNIDNMSYEEKNFIQKKFLLVVMKK